MVPTRDQSHHFKPTQNHNIKGLMGNKSVIHGSNQVLLQVLLILFTRDVKRNFSGHEIFSKHTSKLLNKHLCKNCDASPSNSPMQSRNYTGRKTIPQISTKRTKINSLIYSVRRTRILKGKESLHHQSPPTLITQWLQGKSKIYDRCNNYPQVVTHQASCLIPLPIYNQHPRTEHTLNGNKNFTTNNTGINMTQF